MNKYNNYSVQYIVYINSKAAERNRSNSDSNSSSSSSSNSSNNSSSSCSGGCHHNLILNRYMVTRDHLILLIYLVHI